MAQLEHINYTVSDPVQTAKMLADIFGWHVRWDGPSMSGGHTIHIGTNDQYVALYAADGAKPNHLNHVAISVDDLDAAEQRILDAGFQTENHGDYEPGRRFYFYDHDGIEYEVVSYVETSDIPSLSGGIDHIHVYVPDREKAAAWYEDVFGFSSAKAFEHWSSSPKGPLTIVDKANRIHLALFARDTLQKVSIAFGSNAKEYQAWKSRFKEKGLTLRESDHDMAKSLYVEDPWGNEIEITTYNVAELS